MIYFSHLFKHDLLETIFQFCFTFVTIYGCRGEVPSLKALFSEAEGKISSGKIGIDFQMYLNTFALFWRGGSGIKKKLNLIS